ncbi:MULTISPECIES: hypothetical protein [Parabacteroides]|uniref:Uncharacterized protein n=1 Tax=Parabacteroides distasonis TaxID=823 RepID=A0A3L7ZKV0_PARDI|nr:MULTISPECIES: hypothetical protein [Parabacteroides]NBH90263.1 hypothetical protein [Parabacteroides distasonis]RLT67472.1 hypothetical protein D7V92_21560 [Parabacteroides sp. CH2-D42-20]RLT72515.1 hypothetical protein D7V78_15240 [Parabacteroides distasonis]
MSCSWKIIRDGLSNPIGAKYSNGFTFKGTFDENEMPVCGEIKSPEGKLIYKGVIEVDIYQYFQKYLETGKTIKSKEL